MKILLIGDPHIRASALAETKKATGEILTIIDRESPQLCVIMGDTLDTHERINLFAHVHAVSWFREIEKRTRLVVLIGNHDRENNQVFQSSIHPFTGILSTERIKIVETTYWDRETNLLFVPYVPPGRFLEALNGVGYDPKGTEHPQFIFAHQEFIGSKMGVKLSNKGDEWSDRFPHVFSGHIHEFQQLPGVTYVGTYQQQNFGESPEKGLLLLTIKEEGWETERIKLTSVREKVTVHLTVKELEGFSPPEGSLVKVVLHLDEIEIPGLNSNPKFQAVKRAVDKVEFKVKKTTRVDKMNLETVSLEEVTKKMLIEDEYALNLFLTEVL